MLKIIHYCIGRGYNLNRKANCKHRLLIIHMELLIFNELGRVINVVNNVPSEWL